MSTFDDASLVFIPSGYKTSKAYSVKPIDGSGDLTFTRSNSTASRVASNGLIEKVRTNLALQSQTFDNVSWTKEGCSVTANGTTDPFGASNADVVVENAAASTQHRLLQTVSISNSTEYSTSLYVKRIVGTRDFAIINIISGARVYFNLTTGAVGAEVLGKGSIQNVGNGWYRCSVTGLSTGTSTALYLALTNGTTAGSETYSGDGVSSLAFYGAQLETGVTTDYIATTSAAVSVGPVANVPRLDYLNSSCPRLLLEGQRTNLALFSEQLNNAAWVATSTTVTANTTISPDGYQNADTMTILDSNSRVVQVASLGAGTYTISAYVKVLSTTTAGTMRFAPVVDGSNANSFFTPTTEWARYTQTFTAATGVTAIALRGAAGGFVGNVAVYGFQIELGSYASSYIGPTLGAAVTRGADAASKTGISSLIGQTSGTLFVDFNLMQLDGFGGIVELNATTSGVATRFLIWETTANQLQANFGTMASAINKSGITVGRHKAAITYGPSFFKFFVDGVKIGQVVPSAAPSGLSLLSFENTAGSVNFQKKEILQSLVFKTELTEAQAIELTTI